LNNMMRQLGGSFGIALMNTYISHRTALHRLDLVTHLSVGDPATDARLSGVTQTLMAKGISLWEAPHRALAVLEMGVSRQATLLSYIDTFYLVALLCGLCIPLVVAAGRTAPLDAKSAAAAAEAH